MSRMILNMDYDWKFRLGDVEQGENSSHSASYMSSKARCSGSSGTFLMSYSSRSNSSTILLIILRDTAYFIHDCSRNNGSIWLPLWICLSW